MRYRFHWNHDKAATNLQKHGVDFAQAATVFRDPDMLSLYDVEHSVDEDRWITVGIPETGPLLVVCHTFDLIDNDNAEIRIFSSRKATRREQQHYSERTP